MVVEIAAILVAVAFAVLVGYLVPLLIQVRRTVAESEQLLVRMNSELPSLIADLRAMSQNLNDLTEQARGGVEHASVLLHAAGQVGESVQVVHNLVKGSGDSLLANMTGIVAGLRAAKDVIKKRLKEGGKHNGR
ncbi:MAG: DUF948 domain-containing protein [Nitrospiraceae bacterium]